MKRILFLLMAVATLSCMAQKKPVNPDVYYARRATLFDLLPVYSSDIIMLGNSLTDGAEWNELFDNCHVKNRGIVGDIIPGFFERLEPILKGQPRKIFIMGGVNDISHGVSADSIVSAMTQVVTTIQARCPKTEIYVQSMLPFNNDVRLWKLLKGREQVVVDGNKGLESMCQRLGVTFINLYPLFVGENGKMKPEYTNDGLHLMGGAYLIWRDALLPYIRK
ncbi:MAG: GDSL-type esterase/lipase family protein [Bacteroidales bacterium]|jgi:lysophospholipase L1-like esterase|nr:GDSL-type esterase/lipase family protein [Bacteroidales bacterium]MDY3216616.1 GDSL-type esterase/lipase family protein [Sodaliphilus sp.]MCI7316916.1 GDSL-type esterase/lipase family protein [Bacteroidales bacterium]MCI7470550.1 GDSL-type esterase/lipase family protein [Bacteroidales bacterium]MCI7670373.1 GDSL-type esterase/lipase family protein [Bacteroidales bacterium]